MILFIGALIVTGENLSILSHFVGVWRSLSVRYGRRTDFWSGITSRWPLMFRDTNYVEDFRVILRCLIDLVRRVVLWLSARAEGLPYETLSVYLSP